MKVQLVTIEGDAKYAISIAQIYQTTDNSSRGVPIKDHFVGTHYDYRKLIDDLAMHDVLVLNNAPEQVVNNLVVFAGSICNPANTADRTVAIIHMKAGVNGRVSR